MTSSPRYLLPIILAFVGCASDRGDDGVIVRNPADGGSRDAGAMTASDAGGTDAAVDAGPPDSGVPPPFEFSTTAFAPGDMVPLRYECGGIVQGPGENVSPQMAWTAGPQPTMSYAIVMDDVDTAVVHWVIYDIPDDVREIAEDLPAGYEIATPAGAKQAEIQGSGYFGYFGPCSPRSVNTYRWTVHAIPTPTLTGATRQTTEYEMVDLIDAQSIASASFTGES